MNLERLNRFNKLALPTFVVAIVLGFLISVQYQVQQKVEEARAATAQKVALSSKLLEGASTEKERLLKEQSDIQQQIEQYRNLSGAVGPELKDKIQAAGILSGETAVEGPGVHIEIDDRKVANASLVFYSVTDTLQLVVNSLKYAGAEGIAVNGQRIGARTSFALSGLDVLLINGVPFSIVNGNRWEIEAIGEQSVLKNCVENLATNSLKQGYEGIMIPAIIQKTIKLPGLKGIEGFSVAKPIQ